MQDEADQPYDVSSRKRRLAAFLIDHILIILILISIALFNYEQYIEGEFDLDASLKVGVTGILLYLVKDSFKGMRFGRWVLDILVRDVHNPSDTPSFSRLLTRNLYLFIWPVELLVLASSNDKRRLGDKTAKTIVIKNPNSTSKTPKVLLLIAMGIAIITLIVVLAGGAMKNSGAYKMAIQEIEQNEKIIEVTGGIEGYGIMPTGSISYVNSRGEAEFQIYIKGYEHNITVNVYLTRESGEEWELVEIY